MKRLTILKVLVGTLILIGCSKDDASQEDDPVDPTAEVAENVRVILDEDSNLISSEADLENGIYILDIIGEVPQIEAGDIVIGTEDGGFLRKVSSVTYTDSQIELQTTQANLDDVYNDATIQFTTGISDNSRSMQGYKEELNINYLREGVNISEDGLQYDFSNTVLYQQGNVTFSIPNGMVTFNPEYHFEADYGFLSGLEALHFYTNNASLNIDCDLSLLASETDEVISQEVTLADYDKDIYFTLGTPIMVRIHTELVAQFSLEMDSSIEITSGFTNDYVLNAGVHYQNGAWTNNYDLESSVIPKPIDYESQINIAQNLTISPKVDVKFYTILGPYLTPHIKEDFAINVQTTTLDWDAKLDIGLDVETGVEIDIFSYEAQGFQNTQNVYTETLWSAPSVLEKISGDSQSGAAGEELDLPLKVQVFDNLENPLAGVPVHFEVTLGGGEVSAESAFTDADGYAQVIWTLGEDEVEQSVKAEVRNANEEPIASEIFNATLDDFTLVGTWNMVIFYNDVPVGEYDDIYSNDCPDIVEAIETMNGSFTFNSDETFSYVWNTTQIAYNTQYNSDCEVIGDNENSTYPDTETGTGTYSFNGTTYILDYDEGGTETVQILEPDRIKVYQEEYVRN